MAGDDQATIRPGSKVRVTAGGHEITTYTMYDERAHDPFALRPDSPLGRALIGRKAGETVEIVLHPSLPTRQLTILSIEQ
jgi:transcription elongation GreA/GreB family factor